MEYKRNKKWKLIKWKIKKRMNERYRNEYIYIYIYISLIGIFFH